MKNIVLLERDKLSAGTTWHSAGLVWRNQPSDLSIELLNYTRHLAHFVLEKETGLSTGYNENGGLFIANNKERLQEYQRLQTVTFFKLIFKLLFLADIHTQTLFFPKIALSYPVCILNNLICANLI